MSTKNKRSLMFKLMAAVNISALIILIAMVTAILIQTENVAEKQIDNEAEALAGSLQYTLADYITNPDQSNLAKIAKDIVDDDTINEVYIYDKNKELILSEKNQNLKVVNETKKIYTNKKDILKLGHEKEGPLGYIEIKYNHNEISAIKWDFEVISFIGIVISQLLLAFVMWLALSKSIKSINLTTNKLRELSVATNDSSKELESISEEVSSSASEQAASIQETVATLDEITSQVTTTADSVANSTKKSEESLGHATNGKVVVNEMINSMEAIGQSNKDIMEEIARGNERIGGIIKIINEISHKTSVINDIVFQTKLLSFNASVEAARAGEQGKGFAVVAEEIGKLAQISGIASTEITAILKDSIVKVNSVIEETNNNVKRLTDIGVDKVNSGMKIADKCGIVLDDIVTNATIVKNMMNEISVASKEQAEGVRNIAAAMNQLDQATLNNNKAAAMSSESAKQLSQHSSSLQLSVFELEKEIFGGVVSYSETAEKTSSYIVESKVRDNHKQPIIAKKEINREAIRSVKKLASQTATTPMPPRPNTNVIPTHDDPRFEDV
jgi:methyl-accepting chemotaxis protein